MIALALSVTFSLVLVVLAPRRPGLYLVAATIIAAGAGTAMADGRWGLLAFRLAGIALCAWLYRGAHQLELARAAKDLADERWDADKKHRP